MTRQRDLLGSPILLLVLVLLVAIGCAAAVPIQLQGGTNVVQREEYGPPASELFARYLEDRGVADARNLDGIGGGHLLRQTRRGLDSLSGATFGQNKRPDRITTIPDSDRYGKRNMDEIDHSAFGSFYKRNFDEIDQVGWSGFAKRLDDYLASRQRL